MPDTATALTRPAALPSAIDLRTYGVAGAILKMLDRSRFTDERGDKLNVDAITVYGWRIAEYIIQVSADDANFHCIAERVFEFTGLPIMLYADGDGSKFVVELYPPQNGLSYEPG